MLFRLVVSLILGSLIGMEREIHGRPAGLRTHALVCMGSAVFAMTSFYCGPWKANNDQSRIAAQIVSGVGFLGAGTIIQQGSSIRGLTTAASIWSAAAIGLAVAMGGSMMYVGLVGTILILATLHVMDRVDKFFTIAPSERSLTMVILDGYDSLCAIMHTLESHNVKVRSLDTRDSEDERHQVIRLKLRVPGEFDEIALAGDLASSKDVISYRWE
jgi:putative Mg2+ transporter-C (MgtC) family protein